ncbi:MAG: branched-chain amino acid--2-keto-4-methylthiobutyrate aminotransferase [Rhodospirillaceae bacterium]|nr:branched-chain amino acid--2-keto-4-methylthiobutyrate aminotransferase [Rhodospirillaceae bacterium]
MSESKGIAYSQGRYMPVDEATIPLLDPAFTKSDVVFDVVSAWDGAFFKLEDHLARFRRSCEYIRVKPPCSEDEMRRIMAECAVRSGFDNCCVYFLCTRGRYAGGAATGDPRESENEFIAYAVPYYWIVPNDRPNAGAHLWVAETIRRAPNEAINQRVKNFNRMDLTRAHFEALDNGADAPVLLSLDGYITEGPGFNVWILKDGKVLAPGENLLEGITRQSVFELCADAGLQAEAADLTKADLQDADEVFVSSTGGGVMAVTLINDKPIGNGAPGITTSKLSDNYWKKRSEGWDSTPFSDILEPEIPQAAGAD